MCIHIQKTISTRESLLLLLPDIIMLRCCCRMPFDFYFHIELEKKHIREGETLTNRSFFFSLSLAFRSLLLLLSLLWWFISSFFLLALGVFLKNRRINNQSIVKLSSAFLSKLWTISSLFHRIHYQSKRVFGWNTG